MSDLKDFLIEDGVLKKYVGVGGNVSIPKGVTKIKWGTFFNCKDLTSIIIPEGVEIIEQKVFYNCESLQTIQLPKSLTSIGFAAFKGCKGLADKDGFVIFNNILFDYCGKDNAVEIPEGVCGISSNAFEGNEKLTSITMPESVTTIGFAAFYGCKNLEKVKLSSNISLVEDYAFKGCEKLANDDGFVIVNDILFDYFGSNIDISIPKNVKVIGNSVFEESKNLNSVVIPQSVEKICEKAFKKCKKLTAVDVQSGVVSIGAEAFYECNKLTSISLPQTLTEIDKLAFAYCNALTEVAIPKGVTKIKWGIFSWCKKLISVNIPEGVAEIEYEAFRGCEKLQAVVIPESVLSIESGAFQDCKRLESVTISESTSIATKAFSGCKKLGDTNGLIIVNNILFDYSRNKSSYEIPYGVTAIDNEAFFMCEKLEKIYIPETVKSIHKFAFSACPKFTISTPTGSYAEQFAKEKNISLVENKADVKITAEQLKRGFEITPIDASESVFVTVAMVNSALSSIFQKHVDKLKTVNFIKINGDRIKLCFVGKSEIPQTDESVVDTLVSDLLEINENDKNLFAEVQERTTEIISEMKFAKFVAGDVTYTEDEFDPEYEFEVYTYKDGKSSFSSITDDGSFYDEFVSYDMPFDFE